MIENNKEYTVKEAAAFLGKSPHTVQGWANCQEIDAHYEERPGCRNCLWIFGSDIRECAERKGLKLDENATPQPKKPLKLEEVKVMNNGHLQAKFSDELYDIYPKAPNVEKYMLRGEEFDFNGSFELKFTCLRKAIRDKKHMVLLRHNATFVEWYSEVIRRALEEVYQGVTDAGRDIMLANVFKQSCFSHWCFWASGLTTKVYFSFIEAAYANEENKIQAFVDDMKAAMDYSSLFNMSAEDFAGFKRVRCAVE